MKHSQLNLPVANTKEVVLVIKGVTNLLSKLLMAKFVVFVLRCTAVPHLLLINVTLIQQSLKGAKVCQEFPVSVPALFLGDG